MRAMRALSNERRKNGSPGKPSRVFLALFWRYLRWYVPRSFHAVRVARSERFPQAGSAASERLIVALNHPSWWDPLICILLSRHLLPGYCHYAPMEASALAHYRFMRRLGLFAVDNSAPRFAYLQFLRAGMHILDAPSSVLWITPEGQFTDARRRPIVWKPGLAALVERARPCTVVPLALEYTYWNERLPEALALIGEPMIFSERPPADDTLRPGERHAQLIRGITAAQDELASLAAQRSGRGFETVLHGSAGISCVYDLWKRMEARRTGDTPIPKHAPEPLPEKGGMPHA